MMTAIRIIDRGTTRSKAQVGAIENRISAIVTSRTSVSTFVIGVAIRMLVFFISHSLLVIISGATVRSVGSRASAITSPFMTIRITSSTAAISGVDKTITSSGCTAVISCASKGSSVDTSRTARSAVYEDCINVIFVDCVIVFILTT